MLEISPLRMLPSAAAGTSSRSGFLPMVRTNQPDPYAGLSNRASWWVPEQLPQEEPSAADGGLLSAAQVRYDFYTHHNVHSPCLHRSHSSRPSKLVTTCHQVPQVPVLDSCHDIRTCVSAMVGGLCTSMCTPMPPMATCTRRSNASRQMASWRSTDCGRPV